MATASSTGAIDAISQGDGMLPANSDNNDESIRRDDDTHPPRNVSPDNVPTLDPVPTENHAERHGLPDNTNNEEEEFPGIDTCPISFVPPARAVRFSIRSSDGTASPQVFEYSELFRNVFTLWGNGENRTMVRHPLTSATIERSRALEFFTPVTEEEQSRMTAYRQRHNLPAQDPSPLTPEDIMLMHNVHQQTRIK